MVPVLLARKSRVPLRRTLLTLKPPCGRSRSHVNIPEVSTPSTSMSGAAARQDCLEIRNHDLPVEFDQVFEDQLTRLFPRVN